MDDSILKRLCSVDLNEQEHGCLALDNQDIIEGVKEDELSVLIHIPEGKPFNFEAFKIAMGKSWHCGSFSMQRFDEAFYQVFFGTQDTVDFVLTNGPWNFENQLVLVRPRTIDNS